MRYIKFTFVLFCTTFLSLNVFTQESGSLAEELQYHVTDVTIRDELFEQSFSVTEDACIYNISVNNIEDEEHLEYLFNAADLNEYKISFETGRRNVYVSVETKGGKDLIRTYENGQVEGYVDDFEFYAKDISQARAIVEDFRELVKLCTSNLESIGFVLGDNPTLNQAVDYLKSEIRKVIINEQSYDQSFSTDEGYVPLFKLEVTDISDGEVLIYELNAADINPASVEFDTDDEFVVIEATTRGERDLIKVFENGEIDGYQEDILLYTEGIEQARKLVEVMQFYIEESEKLASKEIIDIENTGDLAQLNDFISKHVKDVSVEDESFKQQFTYDPSKPYLITMKIEEINEGTVYEYQFNLADLNENRLSFDTDGNEVEIELETSGEMDLIKVMENGVMDEYDDDVEFMANGIEEARYLIEAFKKAVAMGKDMQESGFIEGNPNPGIPETLKFLSSSIGEVVIGEDAYQQKITSDEGDECLINYEITDVSEGETTIYKFNLADINVHKTKFYADDDAVFISLETIGENDLIEEIVEGQTEGFENELEIRAAGIEEARKIEIALKHLINHCSD